MQVQFKDVESYDLFYYEDRIYLKLTDNRAWDALKQKYKEFQPNTIVLYKEALENLANAIVSVVLSNQALSQTIAVWSDEQYEKLVTDLRHSIFNLLMGKPR